MKNKKTKLEKLLLDLGESEGLSLLLGMVLISVIVVFSIGVTTLVVDSARQAANVKQGTTAYYSAEAGLEQALWVNKKLTDAGTVIGADTSGNTQTAGSSSVDSKFKIQGTTASLVEKTVNGKYIVPFPWTGNAPWHGDGSVAGTGGCDPQKPPLRKGSDPAKYFDFPGVSYPVNREIEHPCNWGRLNVGEKVTIPLYGFGTGGSIQNFDDIKIRVRTPCKDGKEFCIPEDRLELNCWDKGSGEKKCQTGPQSSYNLYRGEVMMLWQINAEKSDKSLISLIPFEQIKDYKFSENDSQLYEGKINYQVDTAKTFEILNSKTDPYPIGGAYSFPVGKNVESGAVETVKDFIATRDKPVLSLSVIASLVGCEGKNSCNSTADDPNKNSTYQAKMLPYLEYQIILENGSASYAPASKDNIISAEGQAGPFNQTIQVKVPIDNSSLEYVIQQ